MICMKHMCITKLQEKDSSGIIEEQEKNILYMYNILKLYFHLLAAGLGKLIKRKNKCMRTNNK